MTASPRTVLVTGSSGEIGRYLVQHFLDSGWRVLGVDRVDDPAGAPQGLTFERGDLTDGAATVSIVDGWAAAHGAPDVVVNCAGVIANAPLVSLTSQGWTTHDFSLWNDVINSGLTAAFHVTAVAVRHMLGKRRRGVIINISSVCAQGNPGQAAYSAAKAGLNGLTCALAKELGPMGIRVVALAPGYFDTRSTREHVSEARLEKVMSAVPLRRLGALPELAGAVDFIIANPYLNGTVLELDGGLVV